MVRLSNERNIDMVLMEFKEYATEIDVEFVRKSVNTIGRCAIKLPRAAQRCVDALVALIKTKVNYVVQEAIIVIRVRFVLFYLILTFIFFVGTCCWLQLCVYY